MSSFSFQQAVKRFKKSAQSRSDTSLVTPDPSVFASTEKEKEPQRDRLSSVSEEEAYQHTHSTPTLAPPPDRIARRRHQQESDSTEELQRHSSSDNMADHGDRNDRLSKAAMRQIVDMIAVALDA